MDNKNDRQFYWQIKDFMGQSHTPPAQPKKKVDVTSVAKNIVEQNKPYKQSSFDANLTSKNTISQAINYITAKEEKNKPSSALIAKNNTSNPFRMVNEGIFDDVVSAVNMAINPVGTAAMYGAKSLLGGYRPKPTSNQDAQPDARTLNMQDVQTELQNYQGRNTNQPLTARQRALLDREGELKGQQDMADQEQREAQMAAGGDRRLDAAEDARTRGIDQRQAASQQPAPQAPQAPQVPQTPDKGTDAGGYGPPTPRDEQEDRWVAQRMKQNAATRKKGNDELEDRVTYLKARGPSNDTPEGRARHAVAVQRAERDLKNAQENPGKSEDEERKQIRGQLQGQRAEKARWMDWDRASEEEKQAFRARYPKEAALKDKVAKRDAELKAAREARATQTAGSPTSTPAPTTAPTSTTRTGNSASPAGSTPPSGTGASTGAPQAQSSSPAQSPRDFNKASMEPGKVYTVSKGGYAQSALGAPENAPEDTSQAPAQAQGAQRPAPMPTSEKPVQSPSSGGQPIYPGGNPNDQAQTGSQVNTRANNLANRQKAPAPSAMGSLA